MCNHMNIEAILQRKKRNEQSPKPLSPFQGKEPKEIQFGVTLQFVLSHHKSRSVIHESLSSFRFSLINAYSLSIFQKTDA